MTSRPTAPSTAERSSRPGLVLTCVCVCTILVMGLVASINVAIPLIAASDLHPDSTDLLWIVDSYVVVFACLVIPAGAAGDRFGRKGVLLTGLLGFAAGVALSASAPTVPLLLAGRVVAGIGAACVLPNCVGVLVHATAPKRRRGALAVWATVSGLGGLVGNTAGAALLTTGSWRVLFAAVAPVALACAAWVAVVVPRSARNARSLDPAGTVVFVATTVALLVGIIEGPAEGWGSPLVLGAFVAFVLLAGTWIVVELRSPAPLLDPRLFRIPAISTASLGLLVAFFGSFGLFFLNASVFQYVRGYSVLLTGIASLPLVPPLLLGSRFVPRVVDRLGMPATLSVAFLGIAGGLFALSTDARQPYALDALWLLLIGIGFALALPCLTAELTAAMPAEQAGAAGGLQSLTRELGSALGIAVVGTVLTATFVTNLPAALQDHSPVPRTVARALALVPAQHASIIDAFAVGADTAFRVASLTTLVAGILVVAGAQWGRRREHLSPALA